MVLPQPSSQLMFTFFGTCYNKTASIFRIARLNVQVSESPITLSGALCAVGALGCSLVSLVLNPALSVGHHCVYRWYILCVCVNAGVSMFQY